MANRNRILAGTMAAVMAAGAPATSVLAADVTNTDKEEVVYVMADASGTVDSVQVVNIFGKGDVTDYGNYSDVKMLTSTADITQDGDKVTFSTDEDKVYYQGTLDNAQIPWNIKITYTLDGKSVTPEELAGASGALGIHISISENSKCDNDFYEGYALQAAFTLDTSRCENIEADGATLANVGSDKQISYTVLPGKGLEADITADVTDFEMDAAAINGVKLSLNMEVDDEELMEKVQEIMDAADEINDGASDLSDGAKELQDGGEDLNDGAASLYSGASALDTGVSSLNQGVGTIQDGLNTLNEKSASLTTGSAQVSEALKMIQTSLSGVSVSTEQLKQLTASSASIKQGISDLYDGAVALQSNLSYAKYKEAMKAGGLDVDELVTGNQAAITSLSTQITELQIQLEQLKAIPGYESNSTYVAQVQALESQIASLSNIVTLLTGNNAAIGGTETYLNSVSSGVDSLVSGLSELKQNYTKFDAAITELTDTLSGLAVDMSTLKTGIDTLVENYETLDAGISQYTDGVASIVAGYSQLTDGMSSLTSGSKNLLAGAGTLKDGTADLYAGMETLYNGTVTLSDGTEEFYEKTSDMDTQVEDSIDTMIDSISGSGVDVVSFVSDKNKNVESVQFVIQTAAIEKAEPEETVQTETSDSSFWQKLLKLFGAE